MPRFEDRAQSAAMSLVNGLVVENVDPQMTGRVRVRFPHLPDDAQSTWLRILAPAGGDKFGFYAIPEVGDEVIVGFLRGSPEDGVVIGSVWNGPCPIPEEATSPPAPSEAQVSGASISGASFSGGQSGNDGNNRRLWRSRSGGMILFDDTSGAETVQLWDSGRTLSVVLDTASKSVFITSTDGDLHVRAAQNLILEAGNELRIRSKTTTQFEGKGGIAFKSDQDVTIEGLNVTITAQVNFEASGAMSKVAGSTSAELDGGARATIHAGIVLIN